MKTYFDLIVISLSVIILSSCAAIYRCGEPAPEKDIIGTKRLKNVVAERDELCKSLNIKYSENDKLSDDINSRIAELKKQKEEYDALKKNYDNLQNESISQSEKYNLALKQKSDELNEKEKLLLEREKALKELQAVIARQDSITRKLNEIVRNALLGFNSDELSVEIKNGKVYVSLSDKLLFKSGSAAVEGKGKDALKVLADVLNKNTDIDILVEGHTDNVPIKSAQFKDNWDLSVARATSIVRILTDDYKVSPKRLTASGKGEYYPKSSNETAEGRAKNRRTEIILSPKLDELMKLLNY